MVLNSSPNRRNWISLMGAASLSGVVPMLAACGYEKPITVGLHPWIGYETLTLARDFKWLPDGVQLKRGNSAEDSIAGLKDGTLDAACLTLDEMFALRAAGIALTAALVFDVSAGADMVLARPEVRTLADMAGKRIAVEANAVGALVLSEFLRHAKLSSSAVSVVNLSVEEHAAAWKARKVDAAVSYEPFSSALEQEGGRRIFDSRQMPDMIFDVLAVRSDRVAPQSTLVRALVDGHFRGLAHMNGNRQDALFRIAATQGVQPEIVQKALAGVVLPSLEANREYLMVNSGRLFAGAKRLCVLMEQQGLLARADDLQQFASPVWLPKNEL